MQMKQPRFDSGNADFSVADVMASRCAPRMCMKRQFFASARAAHWAGSV